MGDEPAAPSPDPAPSAPVDPPKKNDDGESAPKRTRRCTDPFPRYPRELSAENVKQLHTAAKTQMRKAFWDTIKERINQHPEDYEWPFQILLEIKSFARERLIVRQGGQASRVIDRLDAILDEDVIRNKIEQREFHFPTLLNGICDVLTSLCCPNRDSEIKKLRHITDMATALQSARMTFEVMERMDEDLTRFLVNAHMHDIQEHQSKQELARFHQFVISERGFTKTTPWLKHAMDKIKSLAVKYPKLNEINRDQRQKCRQIIVFAYAQLLRVDETADYPETFWLYGLVQRNMCLLFKTFVSTSLIIEACRPLCSTRRQFHDRMLRLSTQLANAKRLEQQNALSIFGIEDDDSECPTNRLDKETLELLDAFEKAAVADAKNSALFDPAVVSDIKSRIKAHDLITEQVATDIGLRMVGVTPENSLFEFVAPFVNFFLQKYHEHINMHIKTYRGCYEKLICTLGQKDLLEAAARAAALASSQEPAPSTSTSAAT